MTSRITTCSQIGVLDVFFVNEYNAIPNGYICSRIAVS